MKKNDYPVRCPLKSLSLLLFSVFFLFSCDGEKVDFSIDSNTVKRPSPIRLNISETTVPVADYLISDARPDSVSCSDGFKCELSDNHEHISIMSEKGEFPYGNLSLYFNNSRADILLMQSRKIKHTFRHIDTEKKYENVSVVGDFNGWNENGTPLSWSNGEWSASLEIDPGIYGYQLVQNGDWILDPGNKKTMSNGIGGINSELRINSQEDIHLVSEYHQDENVTLSSNAGVQKVFAYIDNTRLSEVEIVGDKINIHLPELEQNERNHLRVWACSDDRRSNDILIPLDESKVLDKIEELERTDLHTQIMYFLMVDRFANGDTSNDEPEDNPEIHPLANHQGGDLKGVLQKLNSGYFEDLGMNTIWLSPIPKNPKGAFGLWDKGGVKSKFSAYHGYWPISFTKIDHRFGSADDLKNLVNSAHTKDKNVILDFVANHVHELHPVYQANKDNNWSTNLYLPDGSLNTERWDDHRLTTWFDVFLPTLNLEKPEITEMLSDSAVYWLDEYNLDGFRHDATKHIPLNFWRTLTEKVKKYNVKRGNPVYQVGETYGTAELISSYIGSGMLDGQFDFNFYDMSIAAIIQDETGFDKLRDRMIESFRFYGHHHLMGNMTGNQDKPRFISLASGDVKFEEDSKLAGWTRDINLRTLDGFKKLAMMQALLMTSPGIPCVYYGDEIGMAGGNDPDNRRMMRFDNLTESEENLREITAQLAKTRSTHMSLLYGSTKFILANQDQLVFERKYFKEKAIAIFNTSDSEFIYSMNIGENDKIEHLEFNGKISRETNKIKITIPPNSFDILIIKS